MTASERLVGPSGADPPPTSRMAALQGLRATAIVLVVLSHSWVIQANTQLLDKPYGGLFRGGNVAVTVFMVLGGFLVTRALLGATSSSAGLDVRRTLVRRWARLSAQVYAAVLVMLVVAGLDPATTYPPADTPRSAVRIVTYTWNWFLMADPLASRPDFGHLWFVSVYLQVTVVLIGLVWVLGRHRWALAVVLAVALATVLWWRGWSFEHEGAWIVSVRTTTRADGMLWGALAAVVAPWLPKLPRSAYTVLTIAAAVGLAALVLTADDPSYYGVAGGLAGLAATVFVLACSGGARGPVIAVLQWWPLVWVGDVAMAIYVWHYPVMWWMSRHTSSWDPFPKFFAAGVVTVVFVVVAHRFIEEPVVAWLARRDARAGQSVEIEPARSGV